MRRKSAFTLIEVLVVVAIIALLVAILIPSLSRAREQARRLTCSSNQRQIATGSYMYAMQHPRNIYVPRRGDGSDSLRTLHPRYMQNLNIAVCPSTDNVVRRPEHLDRNANGPSDSSGGHSFEVRGWFWGNHTFNGKKIAMEKYNDNGTIRERDPEKSFKNVKRPAEMFLLTDSDDQPTGAAPAGMPEVINNWPDPYDNHKAEGTNIAFCDGHAVWMRTGRTLLTTFLNGYYNPNLPAAIYAKYKVTVNGNTFKW